MKNGRDDHYDDPKIASLSAARKKQAAAKKQAGGPVVAQRGIGELLTGALIIAMAIGFLVHLTRPLWQSAMTLGN